MLQIYVKRVHGLVPADDGNREYFVDARYPEEDENALSRVSSAVAASQDAPNSFFVQLETTVHVAVNPVQQLLVISVWEASTNTRVGDVTVHLFNPKAKQLRKWPLRGNEAMRVRRGAYAVLSVGFPDPNVKPAAQGCALQIVTTPKEEIPAAQDCELRSVATTKEEAPSAEDCELRSIATTKEEAPAADDCELRSIATTKEEAPAAERCELRSIATLLAAPELKQSRDGDEDSVSDFVPSPSWSRANGSRQGRLFTASTSRSTPSQLLNTDGPATDAHACNETACQRMGLCAMSGDETPEADARKYAIAQRPSADDAADTATHDALNESPAVCQPVATSETHTTCAKIHSPILASRASTASNFRCDTFQDSLTRELILSSTGTPYDLSLSPSCGSLSRDPTAPSLHDLQRKTERPTDADTDAFTKLISTPSAGNFPFASSRPHQDPYPSSAENPYDALLLSPLVQNQEYEPELFRSLSSLRLSPGGELLPPQGECGRHDDDDVLLPYGECGRHEHSPGEELFPPHGECGRREHSLGEELFPPHGECGQPGAARPTLGLQCDAQSGYQAVGDSPRHADLYPMPAVPYDPLLGGDDEDEFVPAPIKPRRICSQPVITNARRAPTDASLDESPCADTLIATSTSLHEVFPRWESPRCDGSLFPPVPCIETHNESPTATQPEEPKVEMQPNFFQVAQLQPGWLGPLRTLRAQAAKPRSQPPIFSFRP